MTLEEKMQLGSTGNLEVENGIIMQRDGLRNGLGQLSRTGENCFLKQTVQLVNALQHFLMDSTRLGIPAIIHEETLHGVMMAGATVFPQAIARGSYGMKYLNEKLGRLLLAKLEAEEVIFRSRLILIWLATHGMVALRKLMVSDPFGFSNGCCYYKRYAG